MLGFALESGYVVFLVNTLIICIFFIYFGLYLEFNIFLGCIEVYLDFNQDYNLVFLRLKKKIVIF